MSILEETVARFFDEDGWTVVDVGDGHTQAAAVQGDNASWTTMIQVFPDLGVFAFYSLLPVDIDERSAAEVIEFVTRANSGMVTGNFEFDYDSSAVRYKTAIDISGIDGDALAHGSLLHDLIHALVYANVAVTDRYIGGLASVVAGDVDPVTALRAIEG